MGAFALTPDASGCEPGQVQVNPDEDIDCVQGYVPLLGYLFWFGPLGIVFVFAMGLAIVYYAWTTPAASAHGCGRLMGSEWLWRAVRITTLAVMAGLLIVSVWAYLAAADGSIDVARDRSLEPAVPMGALTVTPDATVCEPGEVRVNPDQNDCVKDYVPLVGYLWWFGPLGFVSVFAMGLAIVYYAGGRLPAQLGYTLLALVFVGLGLTVNLPRL